MDKEVKIKTDTTEWDYKTANVNSLNDVLNIVEEIAYGCEDLADCTLQEALENCIQKTKEYADGTIVLNDYESDLVWADRADKLRKAYAWLKAHQTHNIVTDGIWTVLVEREMPFSKTYVFNTEAAARKFVDELRKRAYPNYPSSEGADWAIYEPCQNKMHDNWWSAAGADDDLEELFEDN